MNRLVHHLRSNVIAYAALFVALGGTAYAATNLPPDSVGTEQLKNSAVTKKKIKRSAVTSGKVRDATLQKKDLAPGVLLGGPTGPTGPSGTTGGVDTEILWAVVKAGDSTTAASITRGSHAVSATRIGQGQDDVKFDRDVSSCVYEVTFGGSNPAYSLGFSSSASPMLRAEPKAGVPDTVLVVANTSLTGYDGNFQLLVAC